MGALPEVQVLPQADRRERSEAYHRPIAKVRPPEILAMLQKVAAYGTAYTARRPREICRQVLRVATQTGRASNDPVAAMRGAIEKHVVNHTALTGV